MHEIKIPSARQDRNHDADGAPAQQLLEKRLCVKQTIMQGGRVPVAHVAALFGALKDAADAER